MARGVGTTDQSRVVTRDRVFVDVPPSIGPLVFGTLGVAGSWCDVPASTMSWCEGRRCLRTWHAAIIRELQRTVDPLFRLVGIRLDL
jgi:hypothetical protein